jgi:hypothetical protein
MVINETMTQPKRREFNFVLEVSACLLFIIAGYSGWNFWYCGSFTEGWRYTNGVRLNVDNNTSDFGEIVVDESKTGVFKLHNLSGQPISVLGAETGCGCLTTTGLPITVQPYQRVDLAVALRPDENQVGELEQVVLLNLNIEQPTKPLKVKAVVTPKP